MSNCWAWGVQQRLARSECAGDVTKLIRCCREAELNAVEVAQVGGGCGEEVEALRRCVPGALLGGTGRPYEACAKDFRAVAGGVRALQTGARWTYRRMQRKEGPPRCQGPGRGCTWAQT